MQSIERTFLTTMETDCERTWRSVTRAFDPQCCPLNSAASFRCGSSSAPLVRVTFPSRHDGFRFVLPGTARIAASSIRGRTDFYQCFATLLTSVSSARGAQSSIYLDCAADIEGEIRRVLEQIPV